MSYLIVIVLMVFVLSYIFLGLEQALFLGGLLLLVFSVSEAFKKQQEEKNIDKLRSGLEIFIDNVKVYSKFLENKNNNSLMINHISCLPVNKEQLIAEALLYINVVPKNMQDIVLALIPQLAYFRDDIPENGLMPSGLQKVLDRSEEIDRIYQTQNITEQISLVKDFLKEIEGKDLEFPYKLYEDKMMECENEMKKIRHHLNNALYSKI